MKSLFIFLLLSIILHAHSLIPQPQYYESQTGTFTLKQNTHYYADNNLSTNAIVYLQEHLKVNATYTLKREQTLRNNTLNFKYNRLLKKEAYRLHVKTDGVTIEASSSTGFFYAIVTLMQLMDSKIWRADSANSPQSIWTIQNCYIKDAPRFAWRGMMLDTARNFFSVSYVKKFIDRMAQHKLNIFHWHLSDDEGWRVEIKCYPLLTEVGGKRGPGTQLPFSLYPTHRGPKDKIQAGFYTQEEIKEVVTYALKRNIQVLPEIDIPAHAKAAVMAYPELLQDPKDKSLYTSVQKVQQNTMDPGLASTYQFLDDVIGELTTLFPFSYIHLGGDEVPKGAWQYSPAVHTLMRQKHLHNTKEVKAYFFSKMDLILQKHHRKLIGWQEIQQHHPKLRKETMVMAWRNTVSTAKKATKNGQNIIMAPASHLYFDQQYYKAKGELGHTWAGPTNTKEVYSYTPLPKALSRKETLYIKGVHGCLWSETALNEPIADYLAWPRMLALAEIAWTQAKSQNYRSFQHRLREGGLLRLKQQHIAYRVPTKKF